MMETKHTPGPWSLCHHLESLEADKSCPCGYRGGIYGSDDNHMICEIGSTFIKDEAGLEAPRYPRDVEIANAHLIAAAPDLLEALELTLEQSLADNPDYEGLLFIDKARAAIAKARGAK